MSQLDAAQLLAKAAPLTIPALLDRNARQWPDQPAISTVGAPGSTLTWRAVRDRVAELAAGFAAEGVRPGEVVLIMMSSRTEHWLVDLALVHLGAIPSTVYATLSPDQLRYLAAHSKARHVVLEGAGQLARWQPVLAAVSTVERVVILDPAAMPAGDQRFVSFDEVATAGASRHRLDPAAFETAWQRVMPQQPVTILYTSGTTGDPKGVALSHHNVIYQAVVLEATVTTPDHAPSVAYLPLAHIAERMLGIYNVVYRAGHVHICADPTQVLAALQEVRPTTFFGVPRIWEKMAAALQARMATMPEEQRNGLRQAMDVALAARKYREEGSPVPDELVARLAAVDAAALRPIRATLGLDQALWPGSGAAPIPVEVLTFLAGLGLDVLEVWGMTETTGTATINTPAHFRTGSVGRSNAGMELRLADDGEILVRGPLVCLGYLQADGSILPATDAEGWLATGDVGVLDDDGYLTITDRKKELIITSSGKNVAPAHIESLIRVHPLVGYAAVIGDRRPYVTALVVLDEEMAPLWANARGLSGLGYAELARHPEVVSAVQEAISAANTKLARAEAVKKFSILLSPWTAETGELTPKLSMRRAVISERYAPQINAMYVS
jgi:long-chain acyl-CoA synthetase